MAERLVPEIQLVASLIIHSRRLSADVELLVLMCTLAGNGPFDVIGPCKAPRPA